LQKRSLGIPSGSLIDVYFFFQLCILIAKTTTPYPVVHRSKKEMSFLDPKTGQTIEFPSLNEPWSIHLSVIVPAYEEEVRRKHLYS
jgi:dolichyl-phosphate beta-glucosyltransferase